MTRIIYRNIRPSMNFFVILPDQMFSEPENLEFLFGFDELYFIEDPVLFALRESKLRNNMSETFRKYYNFVKLELQKKDPKNSPKKIKYISRLKALTRGGAYVDKKEGGAGEKEFLVNVPGEYHSYESAPCFIEYFIGMTKRFNMWYPSNHWLWGNRIRDTTFNGIVINFHESPQFLFTFEEIRKFYARETSYSERVVIKNLFDRFGIEYAGAPSTPHGNEYPITYKLETSSTGTYFPDSRESSKLILNNFIGKYIGEYARGYSCPQIEYALGVGFITPSEVLREAKKILSGEENKNKRISISSFIYFIIRREFMRVLYIVNSNLMLQEKLFVAKAPGSMGINLQPAANSGPYNKIEKILKSVEKTNFCSEKTMAEYMLETSLTNSPAWASCSKIISVAANAFPWNTLPRCLGSSIDLNSLRGNINYFRSLLVIPDCTGNDKNMDPLVRAWKGKNKKFLDANKICLIAPKKQDSEDSILAPSIKSPKEVVVQTETLSKK